MAFLDRLGLWSYQVLISLDQLTLLICQFFTYVIFGKGGKPNADETISSKVGRNAILGKRWALVAERIINTLMWFDKDHCRGCIGS